jgi:hypothetical protein
LTTPLYIAFEKRINDAVGQLLHKQIEPWTFFNSGHPIHVKTFDGRNISFQGVGFEGSPREVFWSHYIEPFLENLVVQEIAAAVAAAHERKVDARLMPPEVQALLVSSCVKVFSRMVQTDQRLLGKGHPQSVPLRPVEREVANMKEFIAKHVRAEIEMWKPKAWYEECYERNKFWVWAVSTLVAAAGLAVKFFF